jgi:CRISPR/Cas system-associated exonuclease Cas4 (RecB family)
MAEIPHHLSYSHLHLLACPYAAFLRYEAALKGPTTIHLALGTSIHKALEETHLAGKFNLLKAVAIFKAEYNRVVVDEDVFVGYPQLKKLETEGVEMLELYDAQISKGQIKDFPLAMEKEFEIPIAGTNLVGKIDRIDWEDETGDYTVTDYKSGKKKPDAFDLRHSVQFTAYSWAGLILYGKLPRKMYWHHLRTGELLETVRTMDDIEDLKTMIHNAVRMKDQNIRHRIYHEGVCNWCDYRGDVCEDKELEANLVKALA